MTACPTCGNSVDPLRAPAVGIRQGRIVSYCSRDCAASAESQPIDVAQHGPLLPSRGIEITPGAVVADETVPSSSPPSSSPPSSSPPSLAAGPTVSAARAAALTPPKATPPSPPGRAKISDARPAPTGAERAKVRRPGPLLGISAAIAACALSGGAVAAYSLGYFHSARGEGARPESASAAQSVAEAALSDAAPPPPAAALSSARDLLRNLLRSDSTRIARIAASALARTGDPEAIALLAASVAKESSDLAKLDIYYALARGGDARGVDGLVAALGGSRRDVRLEAARRLALLGNKRAVDTLVQFLDISQHRLGAAEQLAYLAEPRAIRALEAVRADPKSSFADKARAAIALGHAGKAEVAPTLRELLVDTRFNAFAAAALARLRDAASGTVPTLLASQLGVASLRVGAARALRILDPGLDPIPLLGPLVARLTIGNGAEQVAAAEAVFILAGPAAWSERE